MNKSKIYTSKKDEWYTPKYLVDMFGQFDLDPATTKENAERLNIPRYYTKETDGLKGEWFGRVWCNPPFSLKIDFIKKARDYVNRTNNVVYMLLPLAPETKVWQDYILDNAVIYMPNQRINFMDENFKYQNGTAFTSVIVKFTKQKNNTYEKLDVRSCRK